LTVIPAYICPSSTTQTVWWYREGSPASFFRQAVTHYVGIAGSVRPEAMPAGATSRGGMFFRNSNRGVRDCLDGTSNSMVVGEYSGRAKGGINGVKQTDGYASGGALSTTNPVPWYGWYESNPANPSAPGATWHGYKTIQYAPNLYWHGTGSAVGTNINTQSLKSEHTGGIHILMGDGAVRFLSENINLTTYYNLADIADGFTTGEF
jgi:hypothetical protein